MKSKSIRFWLLQIIGWGLPTSINIWGKLITNTDLSQTYIYIEGFAFFVSGIIASIVVRMFLNKRLSFNKFQISEFKIVLMSLLIGGTILFVILTSLSMVFYGLIHDKTLKVKLINVISTLINSYLFILFWLLFYVSIKITTQLRKNKIEKIELQASLKESQLNTLIGQINPHFMFNSLNNIRGLMLEDVNKSREMITRLSEMLRYSLTKTNAHKIAIDEELEMVDNYIELSKIQLEDRLNFIKEIDKSVLGIEIPPMIIQILVENAVKHGISNLPQGGEIVLKISKEKNQLQIIVSNTGKLSISNNSTKVGIDNIKKRVSLMYLESDFFLSEENGLVTARIYITL